MEPLDFSDLERLLVLIDRLHAAGDLQGLVETAKRFLHHARGRAQIADALHAEIALLMDRHERTGQAIVLLAPGHRIVRATAPARAMLRRWFGIHAVEHRLLPNALATLAREAVSPAPGAMPGERRPFVIAGNDRRLLATVATRGPRQILVLREETVGAAPTLHHLHGLSAREAQVLAALATGLTNREIAVRLDLSPNTVRHVVERLYAKLGVDNRAAATALALRAAAVAT
jgi:DNA-binding CsgD family transcriptional regulator